MKILRIWCKNCDNQGHINHPTPKSDKEMMENKIKGIILTPDYNSAGHLTHFHVEKEK